MDVATPRLVILDYIRKPAEQTLQRKHVSSIPPRSLLQFPTWVHALTFLHHRLWSEHICLIKSQSPLIPVPIQVTYHSNKYQKRTQPKINISRRMGTPITVFATSRLLPSSLKYNRSWQPPERTCQIWQVTEDQKGDPTCLSSHKALQWIVCERFPEDWHNRSFMRDGVHVISGAWLVCMHSFVNHVKFKTCEFASPNLWN